MKNCADKDLYATLDFCKGQTVLPGLRGKVFFTKKSNIVAWPTLPDTTTTGLAELATYKTDFLLAADTKWLKIDILSAESSVTSESQGDAPSKTFINKVTLKHSGNNADATGFSRLANADDLVFLVQQRGGAFRVIGNDMFDTNIKPSQESGAKETDSSGTKFDIEVTDICPAPFYTGKIITEEGVISGADGSPIEDA